MSISVVPLALESSALGTPELCASAYSTHTFSRGHSRLISVAAACRALRKLKRNTSTFSLACATSSEMSRSFFSVPLDWMPK